MAPRYASLYVHTNTTPRIPSYDIKWGSLSRQHYNYRHQDASQSKLLDDLSVIDKEGQKSMSNSSTIGETIECSYEIVRSTFITLDGHPTASSEDEVMNGLKVAVQHLRQLSTHQFINGEINKIDAALTFATAIQDYQAIMQDWPQVYSEDADRKYSDITLTVHETFVQAELEVHGKLSRDIKPWLLRNALACILAGSLYKSSKPYEIRIAGADALATISGAEVPDYGALKERLLELLRSSDSRRMREKLGLRWIKKEVPMPENGKFHPEEEKETEIHSC